MQAYHVSLDEVLQVFQNQSALFYYDYIMQAQINNFYLKSFIYSLFLLDRLLIFSLQGNKIFLVYIQGCL